MRIFYSITLNQNFVHFPKFNTIGLIVSMPTTGKTSKDRFEGNKNQLVVLTGTLKKKFYCIRKDVQTNFLVNLHTDGKNWNII